MYGQVLEQSNPHVRNDARPCEAGSSHSDDPTEVRHHTTTLLLHKQS